MTDPGTFAGPGQAHRFRQYIQGCSYVNLCKLVYIEVINKGLYDLWGNVIEHRMANTGIESYLGKELTQLTVVCHKILIPQEEMDRLQAIYTRHPGAVHANVCSFYNQGKCKKSDRCTYVHAELGEDYGRNPSPAGR